MDYFNNDWNHDGAINHLDSYMDYTISGSSGDATPDASGGSSGGGSCKTTTKVQVPKIERQTSDDKSVDVSIIVCNILGYIVTAIFLNFYDLKFWDVPFLVYLFLSIMTGVVLWVIYSLIKGD